MECKKEENSKLCTCSYQGCNNRGVCCDCVKRHLKSRQIPGCFFDEKGEKTFDRSFEHFAKLVLEKRV